MIFNHRCVAVIPCHNEAATIARIVGGVRQHVELVIVVDDGSTDETTRQARQAGAELIRHEHRLGKGAALNAGLRHAHGLGFDWAFTLDGDGQHSAEDIPQFFRHVETGGPRLLVGNRMMRADKMPWLRRGVNRSMSWILSRMAGQPLPDSQCGFRLLDLKVWATLRPRARNFEVESELLLDFARGGHAIQFVPVAVIYRDERSKIAPLLDTLRWFRWLHQARRPA